ncbi:uncharacterized protein A4U43_C03F17150 [Asparagus officinalis]|uniref:Exportin-2 C-terminal domain-containing protein n=1 Tax=Asparagus officinalis TaxID=4686 RepID=A0A5P1FAS0_ASPOF|nr:uncharacterized protein A4U43_C03F17150 [Asparagus officinalis]
MDAVLPNTFTTIIEEMWIRTLKVIAGHIESAWKEEDDPLNEIKDPTEFLVTSLAILSSASPGKYSAVIEQYMDRSNQAVLLQLCETYNCTIV